MTLIGELSLGEGLIGGTYFRGGYMGARGGHLNRLPQPFWQ